MQQNQCLERPADLADRFREFIGNPEFPCVGAKSALARATLRIVLARDVGSAWNDVQIHDELLQWAFDYRRNPEGLRSLAVVFEEPSRLSESEFEERMWERIQSLADKDAWRARRAAGPW